jgi:hypothetical protein
MRSRSTADGIAASRSDADIQVAACERVADGRELRAGDARGCEVECVATGAEAFGDAPQAFGQRISESDGYAAERILGRQRRAGRLFEAVVDDGSFPATSLRRIHESSRIIRPARSGV